MIKIDIGGISVGIDNKYEYISSLAQDYLTDAEPSFTVRVGKDEIDKERSISMIEAPDAYFEAIVAYRHIAEILPTMDAFVFHGSVLNLCGKAYIFTAKSGVGKTTHTRLWLSEFKDECHVLNGDKPVIRYKDGAFYACGTPWRGKEMYGVHQTAPIAGIAFLERGAENRAFGISTGDALSFLISQVYKPKERLAVVKTMSLMDKLLKELPLVRLECNMNPEAAHVARAALERGELSSASFGDE